MSDALPDRFTPVSQHVFADTYGASYICCLITVLLYGMSVLQMYMYYLKYPRDSLAMKLMVLSLFVFGTFHTIMICHTVYHYLVLSYTSPQLLVDGEWSVYTSSIVGAVICFIIQLFFAKMIYHLTKGIWRIALSSICVVLSVAQLAYGIYFGVREIKIWELARLQTIVISSMVPMLVFRISADILICTSLCYTLWDYRPHAEARSRKLISTLIVYAMNRFVLTTMIVIAQMVVLITRPASIGAMVIEFVTIHLYINSLLATLNARHRLRGIAESYVSDFELGTRPKSPRSRGQDSSGTGLDIRTASQWTDGSQWTRDSTTRTGHSHSHPHLHSHPELSRLPSGLADLPMTSVASIANVTAEVKTVSSDVRDDWSSSIHSKRKSLT